MNKIEKRAKRQEWIETLGGISGGPGPTEKYKNKILVDCIEDLEDSINANSQESSKLNKAIIALNIILVLATIAMAIIGGTDLYLRVKGVNGNSQPAKLSDNQSK